MQNKNTPTEGQNSTKLEAESALRDAACSPSFPLPTFPVFDEMITLAPPIPIILLLETAILRIAFAQDKQKARGLKTSYIKNALGRWLQRDADRLFQNEGMTEILEFSAKFWGNPILENVKEHTPPLMESDKKETGTLKGGCCDSSCSALCFCNWLSDKTLDIFSKVLLGLSIPLLIYTFFWVIIPCIFK